MSGKPNGIRIADIPLKIKRVKIYVAVVSIVLINLSHLPSIYSNTTTTPVTQTEILWDTWGVPHIYATDEGELFYAFGWSQMENHGNLLLQLYGEARGRAAEYMGPKYFQQDKLIHALDIPLRAHRWYKQQTADFRKLLDDFARGINDYAAANPEKIDEKVRAVLPVHGADILAHGQRVFHLAFMAMDLEFFRSRWRPPGSNAWAIGPSRSDSGNAMLLANPHLIWGGVFTFFEAHLNCPGLNAYGACLVGMPTIVIGFNRFLGWTHTVNVIDVMDLYQLTIKKKGYLLDGEINAFETRDHIIKIRLPNGSMATNKVAIRHSVFGPVIEENLKSGKALALRIPGLDVSPTPRTWNQYWDMIRAKDFSQFESALKQLQQPFFNIIYADCYGHIYYLCGGRIPVRPFGSWNDWQKIIPGDTSANLWSETFVYNRLPQVKDPPTGWLQNSNDPPWSCTVPAVLHAKDFPSYIAPRRVYTRAQRSIHMILADEKISLDEMIRYKHSTRMLLADRILDDLLPAVKKYGGSDAKRAGNVLAKWDRCTDQNSRGAVLFVAFLRKAGGRLFKQQWDEKRPFSTPDGLKDPEFAVNALVEAGKQVVKDYGKMDVAWGDVNRLTAGEINLPGSGGPGQFGVFRVVYYPDGKKQNKSAYGDTFVAAVEFSKPVKAKVILGYGNASQPHSQHRGDQLELMQKKQMRPALMERKDILKKLKSKEVLKIRR